MEEKKGDGKKKYWYQYLSETEKDQGPDPSTLCTLIECIRLHREEEGFFSRLVWEDSHREGIFSDREEYLAYVRALAIGIVVRDLEDTLNAGETELIHLVRILDETDVTISGLAGKIEDYHIALNPSDLTSASRNIWGLIQKCAGDRAHPLWYLCRDISRIRESRAAVADMIQMRAEGYIPNMSALCGALVASRLLCAAGSLKNLAFMSSSSLQVLGAGPSLFSHLRSGTPPPKHGIIYEYKGIHAEKRHLRGRISRVVASQLVIAARIDYYRGTCDEQFLQKAKERLCRAKTRR